MSKINFAHAWAILAISILISLPGSAQKVLNNGAHLLLNGPVRLVLNNSGIENNGTLVAGTNCTVIFTGNSSTATSFIGGTDAIAFYNIIINKSANGVQLNSNVSVMNSITMAGGNVELNGSILDLGGTGTILGESENSRITGVTGGYVRRWATLNSPAAANPGNIGVAITSSSDLGFTNIRRGHQQQTSAGGGLSILRYFDISPDENTALNANVRFYYFDAELAGRLEPELNAWSSEDGGSTWTRVGKDGNDATINWVEKGAIDSFARVTLASHINQPLPITLLYFRGSTRDQKSLLNWQTSSEQNNDRFEILYSPTGNNYNTIGIVNSHGDSQSPQKYDFVHGSPVQGKNYYRLKQIDRDQHFSYSEIVVLTANGSKDRQVRLFPNPVSDITTVEIYSDKNERHSISLYNQHGQIIANKTVHVKPGINYFNWNMQKLAPGIYYLGFHNAAFQNTRIIKK